jgi:hypothetical protein
MEIRNQNHYILLPTREQAPGFNGTVAPFLQTTATLSGIPKRVWRVETHPGCKDTLLQTIFPMYSALADRPRVQGQEKTIYFEVRIKRLGPDPHAGRRDHASGSRLRGMFHRQQQQVDEAAVAVGFFAPPYPLFRLPGWERGSVGVHSDDGCRYIGNNKGGTDFTTPFVQGEVIGIGMTFKCVSSDEMRQAPLDVDVFLTRNGTRTGGWNMRFTDGQDEDIVGLMGENDLFPAVGVFGEVDLEVSYSHFG